METLERNVTMVNRLITLPYKKITTSFTTFTIVVVLSACSARGQRFDRDLLAAAGNNSAIVVYRASQFLGHAYTADVFLDHQRMGRLKDGGWIGTSVPPGRHTVELNKWFLESGGQQPTVLETLSGESYFLRYDQSAHAVGSASGTSATVVYDGFSIVPKAQALQELEELRESN